MTTVVKYYKQENSLLKAQGISVYGKSKGYKQGNLWNNKHCQMGIFISL